MSAQLSLDSLSGIDWSCPKLAQLEQFALDHVPGCKTHWESHNSSMSVCVEKGEWKAWMRPSLERGDDGQLEWLVRFEYVTFGRSCSWPVRCDFELEAELETMFFEDIF